MGPEIKQLTWQSAYAPFTPSDSEQRLHPSYTAAAGTKLAGASYYRYLQLSVWTIYSLSTVVYTPKCVIPHVALLRQGFPHCAIFPTAASRRSLGRISVPMWPITLSGRLRIVVLVSRYLTNKLMRRESIFKRPKAFVKQSCDCPLYSVLAIR